jgi:hypothetical protein
VKTIALAAWRTLPQRVIALRISTSAIPFARKRFSHAPVEIRKTHRSLMS